MQDLQTIKAINNGHVIFAAQPYKAESVMYTLLQNLIPFKTLLGQYNGEVETAFIIEETNLDKVKALGFLDEQESILRLSAATPSGRTARIERLSDGSEMLAGKFVPLTKEEADNESGWTYEPFTNMFFTIRPVTELVQEELAKTE